MSSHIGASSFVVGDNAQDCRCTRLHIAHIQRPTGVVRLWADGQLCLLGDTTTDIGINSQLATAGAFAKPAGSMLSLMVGANIPVVRVDMAILAGTTSMSGFSASVLISTGALLGAQRDKFIHVTGGVSGDFRAISPDALSPVDCPTLAAKKSQPATLSYHPHKRPPEMSSWEGCVRLLWLLRKLRAHDFALGLLDVVEVGRTVFRILNEQPYVEAARDVETRWQSVHPCRRSIGRTIFRSICGKSLYLCHPQRVLEDKNEPSFTFAAYSFWQVGLFVVLAYFVAVMELWTLLALNWVMSLRATQRRLVVLHLAAVAREYAVPDHRPRRLLIRSREVSHIVHEIRSRFQLAGHDELVVRMFCCEPAMFAIVTILASFSAWPTAR